MFVNFSVEKLLPFILVFFISMGYSENTLAMDYTSINQKKTLLLHEDLLSKLDKSINYSDSHIEKIIINSKLYQQEMQEYIQEELITFLILINLNYILNYP